MTNDIFHRTKAHRSLSGSYFTRMYKLTRLVYFEEHDSPIDAIEREKQIKAGPRWKKERLIEELNAGWDDLFERINDLI